MHLQYVNNYGFIANLLRAILLFLKSDAHMLPCMTDKYFIQIYNFHCKNFKSKFRKP
jgi:hypothetical protein